MSVVQLIFYFFALLAVLSGVMVVVARHAIHSILFLVLTFFSMAVIWMLLSAEFLALILVLVYVGAVMTLFLFVVMMLNLDKEPLKEGFVRYLPFAAIVVLVVMGLTLLAVGPDRLGLNQIPSPAPLPGNFNNTGALGEVLYTVYAYPFEVAGALLLLSIIAAITLTHRPPKERKVQIISAQLAVQRDQRVKLIDIPSEKKYPPQGDPI